MYESLRNVYKIQGEVQQEGRTMLYHSQGRGKFNPHGGFRGRERGGCMVRVRGQIICYNCMHPGHLARDCQNPCTTCSYYSSFRTCYRRLSYAVNQTLGEMRTSVKPTSENDIR
jgi:hypothetical protein